MNMSMRQNQFQLTPVEAPFASTIGSWFYFTYVYASPAMLVELESRMD